MKLTAFAYRDDEQVAAYRTMRDETDALTIGFIHEATGRCVSITTDQSGVLCLVISSVGADSPMVTSMLGRIGPDGTVEVHEPTNIKHHPPTPQPTSGSVT